MTRTNSTVLITGSSRGLGFAFAEWYQQNGWNVIATARSVAKADKLIGLNPYRILEVDTADEASIRKAAKDLEGEDIDLLINNAGICLREDFYTTTRETLLEQFTVNTVGPFLVAQAFIPHVKAAATSKGSAKIVHVSSGLGSITHGPAYANGGLTGYCVSKAGLNMVHASLATTIKGENINVASLSIHPGYVSTDMNGEAPGTITPTESVTAMVSVITNATLEDNGKFFSYDGTVIPW
ncbi:hypothetical protein Poli38472_011124 [Pythium oligandrum]|uniref:Uncharacterized protein n=1 Tax=Pythium oligandrum TaxID=41045 RepID=A0A8K1CQQ1_PYTOL|nr:hypothetical protein Poli38472_011124 [Pythium oligandrum]|eukprot:TMW67504.1 hypothetical protein Poli38472_011124 [Pythium oligandrum]